MSINKVGGPVTFYKDRPTVSDEVLKGKIEGIIKGYDLSRAPQELAQLFGTYSLTKAQRETVINSSKEITNKQIKNGNNIVADHLPASFGDFCNKPVVEVMGKELSAVEAAGYGVAAVATAVAAGAWAIPAVTLLVQNYQQEQALLQQARQVMDTFIKKAMEVHGGTLADYSKIRAGFERILPHLYKAVTNNRVIELQWSRFIEHLEASLQPAIRLQHLPGFTNPYWHWSQARMFFGGLMENMHGFIREGANFIPTVGAHCQRYIR